MHFSLSRLKGWPITFYITAAVLVVAILLPLPREGSIAGLPSVCPFFNITGIPCPGCGLTRSFVCLAHGHIGEAFAWHPLGPLLFAGALLYLVGTTRKWNWPSEKVLVALLFVGMLTCWGLRLNDTLPMPLGEKPLAAQRAHQ